MKWLINLLKRLMNIQTTNKTTDSTAAKQFKVVGRSPNNLPNDNSDENFQNIHNGSFSNTNATPMDGTSYLRQFNFSNPVVYDAWFKQIASGKQLIRKSHFKNIYSWLPSGTTTNSIYLFNESFVNTSDGTTACELYYIVYSLEVVL